MRAALRLTFQFLSVLLLPVSAQAPMNGLTGWWPFDGNGTDLSSAGNHGTVYGAVSTTDRFGVPGKAYHFDGNDYIQMLTAGATGSVSRSVSFWSKSANSLIQVAYGYGEADSPGGIYQVVYNYGCTGVGFDNSQAAYVRGNFQIADGFWHHIAVVYDSGLGSQIGNIKIYVDTVMLTNLSCHVSSTASVVYSNNQFPITIGRSSNSSLRYFVGDLDDFFEYDRPLLYSEIRQLYHDKKCTVPAPAAPQVIAGNSTVCLGSSHIYSVAPVNNATYYTWYIPGGWQGTSISNTILLQANIAGGNISVAAGNSCGSSTYTSLYVNTNACTFLNENITPGISVFPNPFSGEFRLANLPFGCELRLFDFCGREVSRINPEHTEQVIDCSNFEKGIYFITLYSSGHALQVKKLVKI